MKLDASAADLVGDDGTEGVARFSKRASHDEPAVPDACQVFISYRRTDLAVAERLFELLQERDVAAWYDALIPPSDWRDTIVAQLSQATAMVILLSAAALESTELKKELAVADGLRAGVDRAQSTRSCRRVPGAGPPRVATAGPLVHRSGRHHPSGASSEDASNPHTSVKEKGQVPVGHSNLLEIR